MGLGFTYKDFDCSNALLALIGNFSASFSCTVVLWGDADVKLEVSVEASE